MNNGSEINNNSNQTNMNSGINNNLNQPNMNSGINNNPNQPNINKKQLNNKSKIILFIILIIIVIIISIFISKKIIKKDSNNKDYADLTTSSSFFIKDNNKYALFNINGEQLTDFMFDSIGEFINNTALVKKDDQNGVINENGDMVIDFGKYEYIHSAAGLYEVENKKGESLLVNNQDKVLYVLDDTYIDAIDTHIILEDDEKFDILNYKGNKIKTFTKTNNEEINDNFHTEEENGYVVVSFNNKVTLLNLNTEKEILSFSASQEFCIDDDSEKDDLIILRTCTRIFEEEENMAYKLVRNNKLYDLEGKCEHITKNNNKDIICTNHDKKYLIDENGEINLEVDNVFYKDKNTYIKKPDSIKNEINIYNNGTQIKTLTCYNSYYDFNNTYTKEYLYADLFPCYVNKDNYEYYNLNGEKAFDKVFDSAEFFDKNKRAIVKEESKSYLIDDKGNQISEKYDKIEAAYLNSKYYIVSNNGKVGLIDDLGKEIFPCEYKKIDFSRIKIKIENSEYIILETADSKYLLYNLEKNTEKALATLSAHPVFHSNYFEITTSDTIQYYSYINGNLFYERSIKN